MFEDQPEERRTLYEQAMLLAAQKVGGMEGSGGARDGSGGRLRGYVDTHGALRSVAVREGLAEDDVTVANQRKPACIAPGSVV